MIINQENSVNFLEFPKLAGFSGILHGIFTRESGKSKEPYKSLNVGFGVGDDHRAVLENRKIISRCINARDLVFLNQVHGRRVVVFAKESYSHQMVDEHDDRKKESAGNVDYWT
ncbi:MAG: laccase domain-containing protein, partial [Desulfobacterales bacterium]